MRRICLLLALTAMLFGCATTSETTAPPQTQPPDWVLGSLPTEPGYEFFIGSASDAGGDLAAAEEQARGSLIGEVVRFVGVQVTAETSAEARASLDEFQASVRQTVTQTGQAQVTGFRIVDRFVDRRDDRVTVYILGRYERDALVAEQQRLREAFREREEAISGPEAEGMALEAEGEYYQAARRYIEAAAAALDSEVENAEIKFERNITNARDVVQQLSLQKLTDNLSAFVNEQFDQPFSLRVVGAGGRGVPGVQVLVSHKILRSNGRVGIRQETVASDQEGVVAFVHPVPDFVGDETVTMSLDLSADLETLQNVDRDRRTMVNSLEDAILQKRVTFRYSVLSHARDTRTGIVFLETDIAGNPIPPSDATAGGLLQQLTEAGFDVRALPYDATLLADRSDAEIIQMLSSTFADEVERIIYGTASIESFEETDGFLVRVSGSVRALDLRTGEILYASTTFRNSRANTSGGAIASAFRNLGVRFGEDMARSLP